MNHDVQHITPDVPITEKISNVLFTKQIDSDPKYGDDVPVFQVGILSATGREFIGIHPLDMFKNREKGQDVKASFEGTSEEKKNAALSVMTTPDVSKSLQMISNKLDKQGNHVPAFVARVNFNGVDFDFFVVRDHKLVKNVFRHPFVGRASLFTDDFADENILGSAFITMENGPLWEHVRGITSKFFKGELLQTVYKEVFDKLPHQLLGQIRSDEAFDAQKLMQTLTMDILDQTIFSVETLSNEEKQQLIELSGASESFTKVLLALGRKPKETPGYENLSAQFNSVREFIYQKVGTRLLMDEMPDDVFTALINDSGINQLKGTDLEDMVTLGFEQGNSQLIEDILLYHKLDKALQDGKLNLFKKDEFLYDQEVMHFPNKDNIDLNQNTQVKMYLEDLRDRLSRREIGHAEANEILTNITGFDYYKPYMGLSLKELSDQIILLSFAGSETTATTAVKLLRAFAEDPSLLEEIHQDPKKSDLLVNAVIQLNPAFELLTREAKGNIVLEHNGQVFKIPKDQQIWLSIPLINQSTIEERDNKGRRIKPTIRDLMKNPPSFEAAFGGPFAPCLGSAFAKLELQGIARAVARHTRGVNFHGKDKFIVSATRKFSEPIFSFVKRASAQEA